MQHAAVLGLERIGIRRLDIGGVERFEQLRVRSRRGRGRGRRVLRDRGEGRDQGSSEQQRPRAEPSYPRAMLQSAANDRPKAPLAVVLALLAALALGGCAWPVWLGGREPDLSLLAIGDFGRKPIDGATPAIQLAVAEALAREDAAAPVDALLLLGDNFYPNGLIASELETRVRLNLLVPYGPFVTRGAPLWAVLGNHDHHTADGPRLEAGSIAPLVPGFRLFGGPDAPVERLDLAAGVSFVFYDSTRLANAASVAERERLTAALRAAPGPWIVAVAHHPLEHRPDTEAIESAIAAAHAPVQLHLAGHIHDLRVATPDPPLPALQIVSGGGGGSESRRRVLPGERFQAKRPGFARIDLSGQGAERRLRVRLFAVSPDALAELVADWSVGLDGVVRDETR